jgi:hypothetical protein
MNLYDPKCEELARHFLPNDATEREITELAEAIQRAIEDHLCLD